MNKRQRTTLDNIYRRSTVRDLAWSELESLLMALGATRVQASGSRVKFDLNGLPIHLHKPHPGNELKRYQVNQIRATLEELGIRP